MRRDLHRHCVIRTQYVSPFEQWQQKRMRFEDFKTFIYALTRGQTFPNDFCTVTQHIYARRSEFLF